MRGAIRVDEQGLPTGPISLAQALQSWATTASLEESLADTNPNRPWAKQVRGLLENNDVWKAIRPQLQALVDTHQQRLQEDAGHAPASRRT